jgi:MerR family redox-sensitive transcriptional activator SoxR
MLRRVSVVRIAQMLGLTLNEISQALRELPDGRTPTKRDWQRISTKWSQNLDSRIAQLQRMRENLAFCIGCGCLSLKSCSLYNPGDRAAALGAGPRYLIDECPAQK